MCIRDSLKADKLHIKWCSGQHLNDTGIAIVLLVVEDVYKRQSSATVTFSCSASGTNSEMSGTLSPRSHLLTALSDTYLSLIHI